MKYIVASTAVTDEIHFISGLTKVVAGGAGMYALCGIKLWGDDVLLVTGVGKDFNSMYGEWFEQNNISTKGLIIKDDRTPLNIIHYFESGEREEIPAYGEMHYKVIEVQPEELQPYFADAKGIYIFRNCDADFWNKILQYKKQNNTTVMWEISNESTNLDNLKKVKAIAEKVDIFSINYTESKALLGLECIDSVVEEFLTWETKLIYLRRGEKGAVLISKNEVIYEPAIENLKVIDPTGGGNSSSGGILCGFCEGKDLRTCATMGNRSAAEAIKQYGLPDLIQSCSI